MNDASGSHPIHCWEWLRIITDWGGHIDFESEEGKGTCFTVKLPVWKQPETAAETSRTYTT